MRIGGDLSYQEQPIQILDHKEQVLCSKTIPLVKVLWRNHLHEEATWETEKEMKDRYPQLFEETGMWKQVRQIYGTKFLLRGGECNTPIHMLSLNL